MIDAQRPTGTHVRETSGFWDGFLPLKTSLKTIAPTLQGSVIITNAKLCGSCLSPKADE